MPFSSRVSRHTTHFRNVVFKSARSRGLYKLNRSPVIERSNFDASDGSVSFSNEKRSRSLTELFATRMWMSRMFFESKDWQRARTPGNTETLRREKPRGSRNADYDLSCSGSPLFCHLSDRLLQVTAQSKCTAFNIP